MHAECPDPWSGMKAIYLIKKLSKGRRRGANEY